MVVVTYFPFFMTRFPWAANETAGDESNDL